MKTTSYLAVAALCLITLLPVSTTHAQSAEPYLGEWALYVPNGAAWLEVHEADGYLDASLLWYGGSVLPVSNVYLMDDALVVTRQQNIVRERDADGKPSRTHTATQWLSLKRDGQNLVGTMTMPNRNGKGVSTIDVMGKKIPPLPATPDLSKVEYGEPIDLFNGTDLTGWSLIGTDRANGFKVEDGVLINDPVQPEDGHHIRYGNLRTDETFEDFNLKLDVNIPKGNNSGVYLRGIYEIQVVDSYGQGLDPHYMGALYSRVTPSVSAEKPGGEWQEMDITLYKRHITVILNGQKILDNVPARGVTGGAMTADQFSPGPIFLQGDHGKVMYRNMVLTPILN